MSGTSLDGVDAALCDFGSAGDQTQLLAHHWLPYPADLKNALLDLHTPGQNELDRAARLSNQLADLYANAVNALLGKAKRKAETIRAIGCHGQTVRHQPAAGYTLQLNNAARLAEHTGITVISDFRSRDIAAGGQGAPLVPAFHAGAFRHPQYHRVIVNIGGISNLTDLPPHGPVCGFDCGPGNLLMDAWVRKHWQRDYDANGQLAASAAPDDALFQKLIRHPFLDQSPPKSTGREDFSEDWLSGFLQGHESPISVLSTLLDLTVFAIARDIQRYCGGAQEVFLCGGGAHNGELRRRLANALPGCALKSTDGLGISADWVEACAFAWLARECIEGRPGNRPEVTGARGERILGAITPR